MLLPPPHSPWIFTKGNRLSIFSPCGKELFWSGKISSLLQNRLFFHGLMQVMLDFFSCWASLIQLHPLQQQLLRTGVA